MKPIRGPTILQVEIRSEVHGGVEVGFDEVGMQNASTSLSALALAIAFTLVSLLFRCNNIRSRIN